jgi:N-glycosylase/DNA lyase
MDLFYRCIIQSSNPISIKDTLFSGQSFLWNNHSFENDYYSSVIESKPIFIRQISTTDFEVCSHHKEIIGIPLPEFIRSYFSLDIDTETVFPENFLRLRPELWALLMEYFPLRILRQDPFETMITFMCAQGIGMHLIRRQVSMLTETYGERIFVTFNGKEILLHDFPTPERLAAADVDTLRRCTNNNRIRAANIIAASKGIAEGKIDLMSLRNRKIPLVELRNTLSQHSGIGFKIADCIALFGLGRFDAFPIDTHVKQYLGAWFNSATALRSLSPASYLVLDAEARALLKPEYAGYAGHILFHCWRKEIKKLRSF